MDVLLQSSAQGIIRYAHTKTGCIRYIYQGPQQILSAACDTFGLMASRWVSGELPLTYLPLYSSLSLFLILLFLVHLLVALIVT
jgi:hypothetical protein